jgi:hypothetical protein
LLTARDQEAVFFSSGKGLLLLSGRSLSFDEEKSYFRPESLVVLIGHAFSLRLRLEEIVRQFREHREQLGPFSGHRLMEDRAVLLEFEQEAFFRHFTSHGFGQAAFEMLLQRFNITEAHARAKESIEALAKHVAETRATLFQRIGFTVTLIIAPLGILTGYIPKEEWHGQKWAPFGMAALLLAVSLGSIWTLIFRSHRRSSVLARKRRLPPSGRP